MSLLLRTRYVVIYRYFYCNRIALISRSRCLTPWSTSLNFVSKQTGKSHPRMHFSALATTQWEILVRCLGNSQRSLSCARWSGPLNSRMGMNDSNDFFLLQPNKQKKGTGAKILFPGRIRLGVLGISLFLACFFFFFFCIKHRGDDRLFFLFLRS